MRQALLQNIIGEITRIGAGSTQLQNRLAIDKIYEIYILACVSRALRSIGATLTSRDSNDHPTANLVFRLGPGSIYSPTAVTGFIHVNLNGSEFEIQNGIRVQGFSRILHELDVSLIERAEAIRCRRLRVHPVHNRLKLLVECKFYGNYLPLNIGREYLGLNTEFRFRIKTLVSNLNNHQLLRLITSHKGTFNVNIMPTNIRGQVRFIEWLANEFLQSLR